MYVGMEGVNQPSKLEANPATTSNRWSRSTTPIAVLADVGRCLAGLRPLWSQNKPLQKANHVSQEVAVGMRAKVREQPPVPRAAPCTASSICRTSAPLPADPVAPALNRRHRCRHPPLPTGGGTSPASESLRGKNNASSPLPRLRPAQRNPHVLLLR